VLIVLFATVVLLIHTQPVNLLAGAAEARLQLVVAAGAGLLVLLVATGLAVVKPRGLTPYGWRRQRERHAEGARSVRMT